MRKCEADPNCIWGQFRNQFFPSLCCLKHCRFDGRAPATFKEKMVWTNWFHDMTFSCSDDKNGKVKLSCKGDEKRELGNDDSVAKYRKCLFESRVHLLSMWVSESKKQRSGTRTDKKGLIFFKRRSVDDDLIHMNFSNKKIIFCQLYFSNRVCAAKCFCWRWSRMLLHNQQHKNWVITYGDIISGSAICV